MECRLAAILAADVVDYTALMGANEVGTLRRLTVLRQGVLEPLITENRGRTVKLRGNGFLVEFASVVDAVRALCDDLEAALTAADATRARLLEALLHEALKPAATRDMEAAE
ncbi:MAG: hypothetical protein MI920_08155 [Kiloniellales bacterium]|nr:hypothetical protein [Kiloniellales bacterium]